MFKVRKLITQAPESKSRKGAQEPALLILKLATLGQRLRQPKDQVRVTKENVHTFNTILNDHIPYLFAIRY